MTISVITDRPDLKGIEIPMQNPRCEKLKEAVSGLSKEKRAKAISEYLEKNPECKHGYTLQEIADLLGITRERVRQIEEMAMKKLKHPRVGKRLRELLPYLDAFGENS